MVREDPQPYSVVVVVVAVADTNLRTDLLQWEVGMDRIVVDGMD